MRAKGEGSIFYSPAKGLYVARVELTPDVTGKRRRVEISGKSHEAVVRKLRKLNQDKDAHGDLPTSSWTVKQWGEYWIQNIVNGTRRPNTTSRYHGKLKMYVYPVMGSVKLSKVTPAHVRKVIKAMGETSTSTKFVFSVLNVMFRDAVRNGQMLVNPCAAVEPPRIREPNLTVLSPAETQDVLARILTGPDAVLWALYILTGARRAEIAGLTWDKITDESIEISQQLQSITSEYEFPRDMKRTHVKGPLWLVPTKTKAGTRIIPNVEPLRSLLRQWRADAPENPWNLVFCLKFANGTVVPLRPDHIGVKWDAMRDALGASGVRLHDLRHGAVDLLYALGVPERIIIEIVGHSSYAMSRAYKSAEDYGPRRDAMRALGAFLTEDTSSSNGAPRFVSEPEA